MFCGLTVKASACETRVHEFKLNFYPLCFNMKLAFIGRSSLPYTKKDCDVGPQKIFDKTNIFCAKNCAYHR